MLWILYPAQFIGIFIYFSVDQSFFLFSYELTLFLLGYLAIALMGWIFWSQPLLQVQEDSLTDIEILDAPKKFVLPKMNVLEIGIIIIASGLILQDILNSSTLIMYPYLLAIAVAELAGILLLIRHQLMSWIFFGLVCIGFLVLNLVAPLENHLPIENYIHISSLLICIYGFVTHKKHYTTNTTT
ncbi:MAG: hypothetical protein GY810_10930 [Aureispira sp.]|nr:hypothetical protein [Aureispira sp.]